MNVLRIYAADGTAPEDFTSAVSCARTCIESVLHDHGARVTSANGLITISAEGLTAQEFKEKIAGCFFDESGSIYPEFHHIDLQQ
jgi:hypothetical protein